ncbi:hypothetical protein K1T71_010586 [Dendrolimus kikuchii]|uniref:Uncharacterized protein n=1 Tax=Dendrolimus kikuchii TaxID=765133 RepID=A0ACC1CPN4_9NEOP|nr:hypothetical protein K1T71_010586 [Dendrolimus kikuchii]
MNNRITCEDNLESSISFEREFDTISSKTIDKFPINEDANPQRMLRIQLLAAIAVSMGWLLCGFTFRYNDRDVISNLTELDSNIHGDNEIVSISVMLTPWLAIVGVLLGVPLIKYVGRRYSLMGAGVPFFIGWILVANATSLYMFFAGRILYEICAGVVILAVPIYIADAVRPEVRGSLGLLPIAFREVGDYFAASSDAYLVWAVTPYIGAALSVLFFSLMFGAPDSPRWYISKGRNHSAREALQWLRGKKSNIANEMQELIRFQTEVDKTKGIALKQMFYMENIPAVFIGLALMLFQQLARINYLYIRALEITWNFSAGNFDDIELFVNILSVTSVVSTFIAIFLIDRIGRKTLLYISSGTMIVSLSTICALANMQVLNGNPYGGWLLKACVILNLIGFSVGYSAIPWLMLGEILPLKIRDTATCVIIGIAWTCGAYMSNLFRNFMNSTNIYGAFLLFAVIHVVAILFVIFCVPETRGKTLEEIEKDLTHRVKSVNNSHVADANANLEADY